MEAIGVRRRLEVLGGALAQEVGLPGLAGWGVHGASVRARRCYCSGPSAAIRHAHQPAPTSESTKLALTRWSWRMTRLRVKVRIGNPTPRGGC